MLRIGIDLGGTKTEIIVLGDDGSALLRRRLPSPRDDYRATLHHIATLVQQAERDVGQPCTVGIGTPGSISPATGLLRNSNSVWLNGQPLARDLSAHLRREVRLENDANCFALSEATDGAAAGMANVFGVILGTGVGGGIVIEGKVLAGGNRNAGEWGHNPLPWPTADELPGPQCYCGRRGCIETFLSGPGLARDHERSNGILLGGEEIVRAAGSGELCSLATLERYEQRLARALAHVINIVDPDAIVLGGGLSNIERLYVRVPQLWTQWVFADVVTTRLLRNRHGDSGGVRGAAWLW